MHSIRLRGHWTRNESEPGRTVWHRRFGAPRLRGDESVWLAGVAPGTGVLILNKLEIVSLKEAQPFEVEVTDLLNRRNELEMNLEAGVTVEEIQLVIREAGSHSL